MASTLDTAEFAVTLGGMVGVTETEDGVLVPTAVIVADKDDPKPPTGAQRR